MARITSDAIWNWKDRAGRASVDDRHVKRAGWIQVAVMTGIGALLFGVFHHRVFAFVVWGLAALLLSGLLFFERVAAGFRRTGVALAKGAGTGLTWVLLVPFFYLVFGLGRLGLKLSGRDPMHLRLDAARASYWSDPAPRGDAGRYRKQF